MIESIKVKIFKFFLVFIIFILLASLVVSGQNSDGTPSPEDLPSSEATPEEGASTEEAGNNKVLLMVLVAVLFFIFTILFIILRVRGKLRECDRHKLPITGLASENAGMISSENFPEK